MNCNPLALHLLGYFTDLQGSQTMCIEILEEISLVTLLIYKVLKLSSFLILALECLVTLLIYKVLKQIKPYIFNFIRLVTLLIYKVLKQPLLTSS